ncbi:hypothetical protein Q4511_08735 [Paracoccus sp. 1_MG-2023]|uniref:hypothetical protein n=1 Tax=unclassified Paracoccus (in: a-proteobacteria) TaxID=2688777 RepID=UPI001C0811BE|nr:MULTISPECIES: hypothetical protein [unclassified Paracoccus (in: a-proteobacteria)]MBU2959034.1 hypothetical protein [Paracoccus sp. C2R09]MDO6669007.1 hypothetical protein [Paracoccus sp. 1_MG-2023]
MRIVVVLVLAAILAVGIGQRHFSRPAVAQVTTPQTQLPHVGDTPSADQLTIITDPGRYGVATAPRNSHYAVHMGHLVRLNDAGKIISILRPLPKAPVSGRR